MGALILDKTTSRPKHGAAAGLAAWLLSVGLAAGAEIRELVVFGDSGSDSGNVWRLTSQAADAGLLPFALPQSPPYLEGRWSNGPMWGEVLASRLGLPPLVVSLAGGSNYAFAGARLTESSIELPVPSLLDQIELFLADGREFDGDELVVIEGGINDFASGRDDAPDLQAVADRVAELGAQQVALATVPAGLPLLQQSADLQAVVRFNRETVPSVAQRLAAAGVLVHVFDVDALVSEVLADPIAFGFTQAATPACLDCTSNVATPIELAANPDQYVWFDPVGHLTAPMHALLGRRAAALIPEPPAAALLAATAAVCCFVQLQRRRSNRSKAASHASRSEVGA